MTRKPFISDTKFLDDTCFTYSSYFRTGSRNIGGRMHGSSPTSNFLGDRPPVPLSLRPWYSRSTWNCLEQIWIWTDVKAAKEGASNNKFFLLNMVSWISTDNSLLLKHNCSSVQLHKYYNCNAFVTWKRLNILLTSDYRPRTSDTKLYIQFPVLYIHVFTQRI